MGNIGLPSQCYRPSLPTITAVMAFVLTISPATFVITTASPLRLGHAATGVGVVNLDGGVIAAGDRYNCQRNVYDGRCYTFKAHGLCDAAYWIAHREAGLCEDDWCDWSDSVEPLVLSFFAALAPFPEEER